jgi:hypothetical protein
MKKLGTLVLLGCMVLPACATLKGPGRDENRPITAPPVAAQVNPEFRRGMTPREVRAILGEPDDLIASSGKGAPERWKYYQHSDCLLQSGPGTQITELYFVGGRLVDWVVAQPKPREDGTPR